MIAVIDYGRGNLFSIGQALHQLNLEFRITDNPELVSKADNLILPGVGAFADAMDGLRNNGMNEAILEVAAKGNRILGVCLGMQLLASRSEEFGDHTGLDLIEGTVSLLPARRSEDDTRIPNMGWRIVDAKNNFNLLDGISEKPYFYFVHSYGFRCASEADIAGTIDFNGECVPAIVGRDNIWGFQFHPEKSGSAGLKLLKFFFRP